MVVCILTDMESKLFAAKATVTKACTLTTVEMVGVSTCGPMETNMLGIGRAEW